MGSPKALLEIEGETFVDRLNRLLSGCCRPVIVVVGRHAAEIRARARREAVFVDNPDYHLGQFSSLLCGLRAVPPASEGALFTLVDHPMVSPETLGALLSGGGAQVAIPRYHGRRGHPVLLRALVVADLLTLSPDTNTRQALDRYGGRTEFVDVEDPGVVEDIDDPEAYLRLKMGVRP